MKIIFPMENLHVLAGSNRVLLSVADLCKKLGHEVRILGDKNAARPGPDESVKVLRHYELEDITDYYPLESLAAEDLDESIDLFGLEAHDIYTSADIVWSFSALMDRIEDHVDVIDPHIPPPQITLRNHWSYQHWPVTGDYPHPTCTLYANSTYTQKAVKYRWGRPVRLLHPPLPLHRYNPTNTYEQRTTDLIYIGRVDPLKLGSPPVIYKLKDLNILIVGADNTPSFPGYNPQTNWIRNATITQLTQELSKTKVYVHWKGLLNRRDAEHFGITVAESMASGIPTIVPKIGGPWTDIADRGKYCIGATNVKEAIQEVYKLTRDREHWQKWHEKAIEGVQRFSYKCAEEKLKEWLNECIQESNQKVKT